MVVWHVNEKVSQGTWQLPFGKSREVTGQQKREQHIGDGTGVSGQVRGGLSSTPKEAPSWTLATQPLTPRGWPVTPSPDPVS